MEQKVISMQTTIAEILAIWPKALSIFIEKKLYCYSFFFYLLV